MMGVSRIVEGCRRLAMVLRVRDDGDAPACLRINFQPFALPPPAAWCLDAGTAAASTGCGW